MRAAIIAGLMAVGLLAGCGGVSDAQPVESAETAEMGTRGDSLYPTFYCCDGTECISTAGFCVQYCQQEDRVGNCS